MELFPVYICEELFIAAFFSSCDPETSADFPDALNTLTYWCSWVIL